MVIVLYCLAVAISWVLSGHWVATGSSGLVYNKDRESHATSVVIGQKDGKLFVLTAEHVISNARRIRYRYQTKSGPSPFTDQVEVLVRDPSLDIALLQVDVTDEALPRSVARLSKRTRTAEFPFAAWSVGVDPMANPQARIETVLAKRLLRLPRGEERFAWECQKPAEKGQSGGGLFNTHGELIGICSGIHNGKGYFTHIDEIRHRLRRTPFDWLLTNGQEK